MTTTTSDLSGLEEFLSCETSSSNSLNGVGLMVAYVGVFLLGVLGNGVVIFVVCGMHSRRTSTDVYLMHLAVADLLFSLTLPFWAASIYSHWMFGTFLCKVVSGVQDAAFYSCVFLLANISVDRYLAIVKATQVVTKKQHLVRVVCGLVWLAAAFLALPSIIQREAFVPINHELPVCHENLTAETVDDWRLGMRVMRHLLGFFLPLLVMLFCYSCTVYTLFYARNGQKHKAMRVILSVVLAFVICWLPINITDIVDTLMRHHFMEESCEVQGQVDFALEVTRVLAFLHCALNPLLYAFIGKKFRNQLLHSLFHKGMIGKDTLSLFRKGSVQNSVSSRLTSVTL
ncbi:C-X-C chemokine receptor type 1 [Denticeps clupeoides]|uniref:C-X-C chemokine receptor type 2 n=1 Tax=Denticeps clupeoides TaxID=299321 RepID=A0AAY4E178_9TELE|nr:C-X-C chemokine receptor type 1-like [Denticeps clupeoides]